MFPPVAVAQWDLRVLHAALFYLCRAAPSTPLCILRDPAAEKFTIDFAAGKLHETFVNLYPADRQQQNAYQTLANCSFKKTQKIITLATEKGFDPDEVKLDPRGGSPWAPRDIEPRRGDYYLHRRELARRSTDEELDHLRKREEMFEQKQLLRNQGAGRKSPPPSSWGPPLSLGTHATSPGVNVASLLAPEVQAPVEASLRALLPAGAVAKMQALTGKLCSEQSGVSHMQSTHAEMLAAHTAQMARTEAEAARQAQGQTQLPTERLGMFSEHATSIRACLDAQKARDVAESSEMETATSHRLTHEAAGSMCDQKSFVGLSPSRAEMALVAELQEMQARVAQQDVELEGYRVRQEERDLAQEYVVQEAERAEQAEASASGQQHELRAQMDAGTELNAGDRLIRQENALREIAHAKVEQCKQQEERDTHLEIAMAKAEAAMIRASKQAEMAEAAVVRQAKSEHAFLESKLASQANYAEHELALANAAVAEKASELAEKMKLFAAAAARQAEFETEIQQLRDQGAAQGSLARSEPSAPAASRASGAEQGPPTKRSRSRG